MYDVPHLIKCTRNSMLDHTIEVNGKELSSKYIEEFYKRDKVLHNRMAPNLTDSHMHPTKPERMKVKLATQLLSNSVAAGLTTYISLNAFPASLAAATLDFVELRQII